MKQTLLTTLFFLFTTLSYGQIAYASTATDYHAVSHARSSDEMDLKIFPNPAVDHIHFNNYAGEVKTVVFFNLVGRPIKQVSAVAGRNHYDLNELSRGLYLVQLMNDKGKVVSTKRLNKR